MGMICTPQTSRIISHTSLGEHRSTLMSRQAESSRLSVMPVGSYAGAAFFVPALIGGMANQSIRAATLLLRRAEKVLLTQAGREGLAKIDETALQILQPGALAQTLVVYSNRFGDGFLQKAQEAIRCRDCGAWLASCAMAGAAAEAVLLATAIAKRGDEEKALKEYLGVNGRRATINFIGGQLQGHMQEQLRIFAGIISLWRDDAAHGLLSVLTAANAEESLRQLLHMCQWFEKHWAQLTA